MKWIVVGLALGFASASFGQSIIKRGYVSLPPTVSLYQVDVAGTGDAATVQPAVLQIRADLTMYATAAFRSFYGMDEDSTTMDLASRITVIQDVELIKWLCWSKKCDPNNAYAQVSPTQESAGPLILPGIAKGPYDNGNGFYCVVQYIQRGNYNIRRYWGLLFSPPGTFFRLYITYSRVGGKFIADGSTIPTRSYQNFSEWKVRVDAVHMIGLINMFRRIPAGVSEVPKISPAVAVDLVNLVNYINDNANNPNPPLLTVDLNNDGIIDPNTPEEVRSASDAVFVFIDLVGRYCVGPTETLGNQYSPPDVGGTTSGDPGVPGGGFNYQYSPLYYKSIFNSREEPVCCKLISDIEALAQFLGVPILAPGVGR